MDLVIKPTFSCNFRCSFCSSNRKTKSLLSVEQIEQVFKSNTINNLIVNGGDPLLMPPSFYYDLKKMVDKYNPACSISLTTNLWDWYKNPDKWTPVIKECNLGICTSFQYGSGRIMPNGKPLDVKTFLNIFNRFKDTFNYPLEFISVLTDENEQFALDNVLLARDLKTFCKLNGAFQSGRQGYLYDRTKLFQIYLHLFETGLYKYERNCLNLINFFKKQNTICPLSNQKCFKTISCLSASGNQTNCPALEDDDILDSTKYKFFKKECLACDYFQICNGCMKQVRDLLNDKNGQLRNCLSLKDSLDKIKSFCLTVP